MMMRVMLVRIGRLIKRDCGLTVVGIGRVPLTRHRLGQRRQAIGRGQVPGRVKGDVGHLLLLAREGRRLQVEPVGRSFIQVGRIHCTATVSEVSLTEMWRERVRVWRNLFVGFCTSANERVPPLALRGK